MMRAVLAGLFTILLASTASHAAEPITLRVQYPVPGLFGPVQREIAGRFMAENPHIRIEFMAAAEDYDDLLQRTLRAFIVADVPDVSFPGLGTARTLVDRGLAVDITEDLGAEGRAVYGEAALRAGRVGDVQACIPFAVSIPAIYFNHDLVMRAGGDVNALPRDWPAIATLAGRIAALGEVDGVWMAYKDIGNWTWQALVGAHGGTMMSADDRSIAFTDEAGRKALSDLALLVTVGGMQPGRMQPAVQNFIAGRLGILVGSTALIGSATRAIGNRFAWSVMPLPANSAQARVPAGGNCAMVLARDPSKRAAALAYVKFATGPVGGAIMAKMTGYLAPHPQAIAALADFYAANPRFATGLDALPALDAWYGFPGRNSLKIPAVIDIELDRFVASGAAVDGETALASMARAVSRLLPATLRTAANAKENSHADRANQ